MNTSQTSSNLSLHAPRRRFFAWFMGAVGALSVLPSRLAYAKKIKISMSKLPQLAKVGGAVLKKIGGQPVLLVRSSEKTIKAFNPECTHKKCVVEFKEKTGNLHCKCHKSAYDLSGQVLGGPAPKPLQIYRTKLKEDYLLMKLDPPENFNEPKPANSKTTDEGAR
jgi:Rieske Fe-S protein